MKGKYTREKKQAITAVFSKSKSKVHPTTGHGVPDGE
jgi:stalled ribosome alternative rescue factor ArfA